MLVPSPSPNAEPQTHDRPSAFGPVVGAERVETLDVLRGFALFGVLLSNLETTSGETIALTAAQAAALPSAALDSWVLPGLRLFVNGKFIALFTVLFGIGFTVQRQRATTEGVDFAPLYIRRQLILLLIGGAHLCLWWGDILHFYAVLGLILLWADRLTDRQLAWLGGVLVVLPYTVANGWSALRGALGWQPPPRPEGMDSASHLAHRLAHLVGGDWRDLVAENFAIYTDFYTPPRAAAMALFILGYFFLGMVLGRRGWLQEPTGHRRGLIRLLIWGTVIGLPSGALMLVVMEFGGVSFASPWIIPSLVLMWVGVAALAGAYLAAIVLLMQHPACRRALRWLGPVGRMALSNYLLHSVFFLLFLDRIEFGPVTLGLGWLGGLGASGCLGLAAVLFLLQVFISRWWLSAFRFGPVEWLWRSLTYGRMQPWRRL